MAGRTATIVRQLMRTAGAEALGETDRDLLRRFADANDQTAFAALVRRHTGMVFGVCRRCVPTVQDAEDACQATFVILAGKASRVRWQPSVANWLFTTARQVAHNAQVAARRRARRESRAGVPEAIEPVERMTGRELLIALDEELGKLSPRYREPLVLCYLEGLTRDEAAARLAVPAGTLKTRLERGRKRLHDALTSRGLGLGAGLLALACTSPAGASPSRLTESVLAAASGNLCPAVAALAKGVAVNGVFRKSLLVMLATAGAAALGLGMRSMSLTAADPQPTPNAPAKAAIPVPKDAPKGADPAAAATGEAAYAGRVLDADGKPVAGATLYTLYYTPKVLPIPERGVSDKDGTFRFTVAKKEFDRSVSARPWDEALVFAVADGYGVAFPQIRPYMPPAHGDLTLRLVKDDVPITGRVLDLQGKPVAGATAVVREFWWPTKSDDLGAFLATLKEKGELYPALIENQMGQVGLWMGRDIGRILPPAVTDAEGRFRLKGIGRERVVALSIEGTTVASTDVWAMTRAGEPIRLAMHPRKQGGLEVTLAGATFEQIVAPSRPIVGTIRDKDTGKPIPGAVVESYVFGGKSVTQTHLRAVADKEGRYRLLGMPKVEGNQIRIGPPEGQPYLMALATVRDGPGLEPVTVDVELKRGVWITGKVTDEAAGKPVPSWIRYAVFGDNPNLPDAPGLIFEHDMKTRPEDATFRFVGLPGRGVVAARAWQAGGYRVGAGAERIKDLDRFLIPAGGARGMFSADFHTIAEVNPEKGAESATCDLVIVAGVTLTGTIVGPDGKPLAGALARGLNDHDYWEANPAAAEFRVTSLRSGEPRLLQFSHPEKKLAGSLVVRDDAKGRLIVKLEPAGTLTGRFVTTDGKPLADLELFSQTSGPMPAPGMHIKPDVTAGSFPRGPRTDKDGKFRIEGLAPGLSYRLAVFRGMFFLQPEGDVGKGVTLKAGETKDLGELKVQLPNQ
jgi:RNA polymerase sigma factor (sigma-70 family)